MDRIVENTSKFEFCGISSSNFENSVSFTVIFAESTIFSCYSQLISKSARKRAFRLYHHESRSLDVVVYDKIHNMNFIFIQLRSFMLLEISLSSIFFPWFSHAFLVCISQPKRPLIFIGRFSSTFECGPQPCAIRHCLQKINTILTKTHTHIQWSLDRRKAPSQALSPMQIIMISIEWVM